MGRMARFAEIVGPNHIIIENVPGALHDRNQIVDSTIDSLRNLEYEVEEGVIDVSLLGVPQKRRRFVIVASRVSPNLQQITSHMRTTVRTVRWAINDLRRIRGGTTFDTPSNSSHTNRRRIDHLFKHRIYDLPNTERPDCHRLREHTYNSIYGRLRWNRPAQTITTGFGSMGQGRYVHPSCKRLLTPHEVARLQFFPDFFDFGGLKRSSLSQLIGNAVPAKLTYAIALSLLASAS